MSEHPLAAAIVAGAMERGLRLVGSELIFEMSRGRASVEWWTAIAWRSARRRRLSTRHAPGNCSRMVRRWCLSLIDGKPAGILGIADPVKPSAREAIAGLHHAGLRIVMLTGDNRVTAEVVARKLGIDEVRAEVHARCESGRSRSTASRRPHRRDGRRRNQ